MLCVVKKLKFWASGAWCEGEKKVGAWCEGEKKAGY
jgi:hypothetical protein